MDLGVHPATHWGYESEFLREGWGDLTLGQVGCRKERIYLEKVKRGAGRFAGRLKIYLFTIGGRGPLRAVKMLL